MDRCGRRGGSELERCRLGGLQSVKPAIDALYEPAEFGKFSRRRTGRRCGASHLASETFGKGLASIVHHQRGLPPPQNLNPERVHSAASEQGSAPARSECPPYS